MKSRNPLFFIKTSAVLSALALLQACSSTSPAKKVILDESASKPSWVTDSKISWEEDSKVRIKSNQQVRGNERLSACYDIARLNAKSSLISEIQENIKGILDSHEATLSENAEVVLSKSRSAEFEGKISGLRFTEEYFVRYLLMSEERIDCLVLSEIAKDDYNKLKRAILYKVEEADPRIKEQIKEKHIDFFKSDKT